MGLIKELDVFQAFCEEENKVNQMNNTNLKKIVNAVTTLKSALEKI